MVTLSLFVTQISLLLDIKLSDLKARKEEMIQIKTKENISLITETGIPWPWALFFSRQNTYEYNTNEIFNEVNLPTISPFHAVLGNKKQSYFALEGLIISSYSVLFEEKHHISDVSGYDAKRTFLILTLSIGPVTSWSLGKGQFWLVLWRILNRRKRENFKMNIRTPLSLNGLQFSLRSLSEN